MSENHKVGTLSYTWRGLAALFAWLLWGDFCWSMMEAVVPSIIPLKMQGLNASNTLMGVVLGTIPAALNLTITPYLSFRSDHHRGPMGRRTPFILYTIPFICLSMILIAYCDPIALWVNRTFLSGDPAQQAKASIIILAVFVSMFNFFNMFVSTVYWYLFADVVPEAMMGRFMGWFRLVGLIAGFLYNYFVFPLALSHMREIYIGGALLYLIGFGVVCLKVKEGQYPPSLVKRTTLWEQMRTYARECYTLRYYWDINLTYAVGAMAGCVGVFNIFYLQSLGLDLKTIGRTAALTGVALPVALLFAGSLVDRWHAVRVNAYFGAAGAFGAFGSWVWLFVTQAPPSTYWLWINVASSCFGALAGGMMYLLEIPRLVELFPRDKFGQYCGSIAMLRGPAGMVGGLLAGLFMDQWIVHVFPKEQYGQYGYRFGFLWSAPLVILAFYFQYRTFRVWKRLGGGVSFTPPTTSFRLCDLPPRADGDDKVRWGLVLVQTIAMLGTILGGIVWWRYYAVHTTDTRAATAMLISWISAGLLFVVSVRFIKFMERP
jgi:MFS family permease